MGDPAPSPTPSPSSILSPPAPHPSPRLAQGGPLLVTPAGSTLVATDRMQAHLEQLSQLERQLTTAARTLHTTEESDDWSHDVAAPSAARRSTTEVIAALHATRTALHTVDRLQRSLRRAIAAYDDAEAGAHARVDRLAAVGGAELGWVLRSLVPELAVLGLVAWAASKMPDPGGVRAGAVHRFFLENPQLITGPVFVEGVRQFTSGLDEGMSTFGGVPVPLAVLLGASGATGIRTSARELLRVGPLLGVFRETPVNVTRVDRTTSSGAGSGQAEGGSGAPAIGALQRLERVPEVNQVRVEKYDAPGQPSRFVVYVGPTETFSPTQTGEPWDLTSNVGGVGGLDVGAFRASEVAMRDAGVTSDSSVQFVGFSQGGLLAAMLAGSGDWKADSIQTFGAPSGNIEMPAGLGGMAVRNTDDFIPMLAGPQLDHHVLQVERRAYSDGQRLPTDEPAPAHERDAYLTTAAAIDRASSGAVRTQSDALDAFTADYASQAGSSVTVSTYHAQRVGDLPIPGMKVVTTEAR